MSSAPDWEALRLLAMQRIRAQVRSVSAAVLEDLTQELLVTLFRLSRRERLVHPEALVGTLAHRVCVDHVRRGRGPAGRLDPVPDSGSALGPLASGPLRAAPVDLLELLRFLVLEHLREQDASCQELASMFYAEQSWSSVAEQLGIRHHTVIKRWSRCTVRVRKLVSTQQGPVWEWARSAGLA